VGEQPQIKDRWSWVDALAPLGPDEVEPRSVDVPGVAPEHGAGLGGARARIIPACAEGKRTKVVATAWLLIATRLANGVGASPSIGLKVSGTNRDRGRRALPRIPDRGGDRPHP
jgi:hypothetical protein